jgi:hypothetical protein
MQDAFQLKFDLMENEKNAALSHLQQEKAHKDDENKQLKEELAKLQAELNRNTDNDLSYDSHKDDDNSDINYDSESSGNEEEANTIMNLQQEQARKDKENKQPKEQLAHLREEFSHNADNDLNYDSPEDDNDESNDANYKTESSDDEKHDNSTSHQVSHQNTNEYVSNEMYTDPNDDEMFADPNYNSSDNEDPRNDLYLD